MKQKNKTNKPDYYYCCNHYSTNEYLDGYVMWKPIKIKYCKNCGEVQITSRFWGWFFETFLQCFWNGEIVIYENITEGKNA